MESVIIQENRNHHLLNSRSEYNRCAVPRLSTKIGENEYKKWEEDNETEREREEEIESKIRKLKKERNRNRMPKTRRNQPPNKRRKMNDSGYTTNSSQDTPESTEKGKKRKMEEKTETENGEQEQCQSPALKRRKRQTDIREVLQFQVPQQHLQSSLPSSTPDCTQTVSETVCDENLQSEAPIITPCRNFQVPLHQQQTLPCTTPKCAKMSPICETIGAEEDLHSPLPITTPRRQHVPPPVNFPGQQQQKSPLPKNISINLHPTTPVSPQEYFLNGEKVEFMQNWEERIHQHREEIDKENKEREKRVEEKEKKEKSWELLRQCRDYLKENEKNWKIEMTERERKRIQEEERERRLARAEAKKGDAQRKLIQTKMTDSLRKLPQMERERILQENERTRRFELRESKVNIWKKWRGEETKVEVKGKGKSELELQKENLAKIEETLERIRKEEIERRDEIVKETKRKKKLEEDKKERNEKK